MRTYPEHPTAFWLRHFALALAALASLMTPLELILVKHYTQSAMLIPFALVALALLAILAVVLKPTPLVIRLFRGVMGLLFVASAIGVFFHLRGNLSVARDIDPTLSGLSLIWGALTGAAPALAPGLLAQVGLLGLAYTFHHPNLAATKTPSFASTRPTLD